MKRKIKFIICFFSFICLLGCNAYDKSGKNKEEAKKTPASKKKIALVMKTLTNPFFIEMEKGARKAQEDLGIDLMVKTGAQETSIDQQISIVEELISLKVDGIVIAPANSTDIVPVLKKAQDAKIPIVNVDDRLDIEMCKKIGLINVPFVSIDNENAAYLSAKYISNMISKPTKAAILEGIPNASNSEKRKLGAIRAFKENNNITVAVVDTAHWKINEAYSVTKRMVEKDSDIGVIYCANDMMALGASEYVHSIGRKDIKIAGFDALAEVKEEIHKGNIMVTVDQQPQQQAYKSVEYVYRMINGEKVPMETLISAKLINRDEVK